MSRTTLFLILEAIFLTNPHLGRAIEGMISGAAGAAFVPILFLGIDRLLKRFELWPFRPGAYR